jgi:hypothetical protein
MTTERYWVVGGEYSGTDFKTLKTGAAQAAGPFDTREEARRAWQRLSDETRSCATAKYAITAEQLTLPN